MPLPPRRNHPGPASAPRPGFQVPRKTTRHFSPFEERREVEIMDAQSRARVIVTKASAGVGASSLGAERDRPEVGLDHLIALSKGRPPRTAVAQSLGFDVIPAHAPVVTLPDTPFPATASTPTSKSFPNPSPIPSSRPSLFTASASLLTAGFAGLSLSKTPELSRSASTLQGSPDITATKAEAKASAKAAKVEDESGGWERIPSFRSEMGEDAWVGIEDDDDEDLMFWDEKDERELVGETSGKGKAGEVGGAEKVTLSYARVLKG